MPKYRKKPVVIEALELRWDNWNEMCDFAGVGSVIDGKPEGCWVNDDGEAQREPLGSDARIGLWIPTLEGVMLGIQGDFIIRGVENELYPCKPEIFWKTYEEEKEEVS